MAKLAYEVPDIKIADLAKALAMITDKLTNEEGEVIETDAKFIDRYITDHLKERDYAWRRRELGIKETVDDDLITIGATP